MKVLKIGFDLDGVVANQDICILQIMRMLEVDKCFEESVAWIREWYYRERTLLLNPKTVMTANDEGYIITCRGENLKELTELWCRANVPNLKLIIISSEVKTESENYLEWIQDLAKLKAEVITNLKLDVYFEDVLQVAEKLRELCPDCKIIKYGETVHERRLFKCQ